MKRTCSFWSEGSEARTGEVLDPKEEGFFLASNSLYPPGTALDLVLQIAGNRLPVRLRGEVLWARTNGRAGMFVMLVDREADARARERASAGPGDAPQPRGPKLTG